MYSIAAVAASNVAAAYPNFDVQVPLLAISLSMWCYFSDGREYYYYYLDDGRNYETFNPVWNQYCTENQSRWRAGAAVNQAWRRWVRRRRFKMTQGNRKQQPKYTLKGNVTFAPYRRPTTAARWAHMLRGEMRRAMRRRGANTRTANRVNSHPAAPTTAPLWYRLTQQAAVQMTEAARDTSNDRAQRRSSYVPTAKWPLAAVTLLSLVSMCLSPRYESEGAAAGIALAGAAAAAAVV